MWILSFIVKNVIIFLCYRFGLDDTPSLFTVDCPIVTPSYLTTYQCSIDPSPPSCTSNDDVSVYCCKYLNALNFYTYMLIIITDDRIAGYFQN